MEINSIAEKQISATVKGFRIDTFDEDIKGVTYHDAEVQKNEAGNYGTLIIFDI
jgi:SHS2 domain-containing protein